MARLKKEDSTHVKVFQRSSEIGNDPLRALVQHTIQQVLEEELMAFLNAEPCSRTLKTRVGYLELMVPKDREGRFQM